MQPVSDTTALRGWKREVAKISPAWFTITMGTGIVSILVYDFPCDSRWQNWLAIGVFTLNVFLFTLFVCLLAARSILCSGSLNAMMCEPSQAIFLGAIPISLGTIVSMLCYVCVEPWGCGARLLAVTLWAVQAVSSVLCVFSFHSLFFSTDRTFDLSQLTARHLFPAISCIVASATGSAVAVVLPDAQHALCVLLTSYVLWGIGFPMAMMITTAYFQRLMVYKLPSRELIVTAFIPIGPLGQGGFAILRLGELAHRLIPQTNSLHSSTGDTLWDLGVFVALLCWSGALIWTAFAAAAIYHSRSGFPFNVGWWSFVFPLGTLALCSNAMGTNVPSQFFRVFSLVISTIVFALYIVTAGVSFKHAFSDFGSGKSSGNSTSQRSPETKDRNSSEVPINTCPSEV